MARRWARVLLVMITFPVPFTNLLSGALLVLVTRVAGWREAALDAALALGLLVALLAAAGGAWVLPVLAAAGFWAGAVLAGHLLNRYGSLTLPFQVLVAAAAAGVLLAGVLMPDPGAYWGPVLADLVAQAGLPGTPELPPGWLDLVARMMNGLLAASTLTSVALALVIGQWLASRGAASAFGLQFASLRMGRVIGGASLLALVAALAGAGTVAGGMLLTFGVGFVLQGLAVVHWTARQRRWPRAWPLAVYLPLVLSPAVAGVELLLLALLGFVDNWWGLRPGVLGDGPEDVLK